MTAHKGTLGFYFDEPGTEGLMWILREDGGRGPENCYETVFIDPGDFLTVYDENGMIIFFGEIVPDFKAGRKVYHKFTWREKTSMWICYGIDFIRYAIGRPITRPYMPLNSHWTQPVALGFWIHWTQKSWKPDDWARLFIRYEGEKHFRAELCKKEGEETEEYEEGDE